MPLRNDYNKVVCRSQQSEGYTTVIVPVFDDIEGLRTTLKSLRRQNIERDLYEILVVSDGGQKKIKEQAEKYDVTLIEYFENKGSYYARNQGLEQASGEYIAFVDTDIALPRNWLRLGLLELQESDYVAGNVVIDKTKAVTIYNYYQHHYEFDVQNYMKLRNFGVTANLFIRRKIVETIGGFDTRLRSSGDLEFGSRVHLLGGFRQSFSETITVEHPPRSYHSMLKKYARMAEGFALLHKYFPERFPAKKISHQLISIFRPVRMNSIKKFNAPFSRITKLLFLNVISFYRKYVFLTYQILESTKDNESNVPTLLKGHN